MKALIAFATLVTGVVIAYFAVIFGGPFPDHPALRGQNDLVLHVAAFLALTAPLLLLGAWRRKVAGLVGFAGLIEIVQIFQVHRSADWGDFVGSVVGIALGALIAIGLRGIAALVTSQKEQTDE